MRYRSLVLILSVTLLPSLVSCSKSETTSTNSSTSTEASAIRMTGSDTMVNLAQAWAEKYSQKNANVSVQVAGGGSGVGIAGLIDNFVDIAASSRKMSAKEIARAKQNNGVEPREFIVGLDALAVYVQKGNPLNSITVEELAEIYGEGGKIENWSQLGIKYDACDSGKIVRVSRQNNSGTYVYFREAVVGEMRDFKLGSIDQNGSKDVVTLVGKTACAIGYSGMAYATPEVKMLNIAKKKGDQPVAPTSDNAANGSYPIARPLFLYTKGEPEGAVKEFIDWVLGVDGQKVVAEVGYVPNSSVAP